MEHKRSPSMLHTLITVFLNFGLQFSVVESYERNCDYWDPGTASNANYLDCKHSGCCGSFKDRHCCRGPIVPVAVTFAVVIAIVIVGLIIYVSYEKYQQRKRRTSQTIPEKETEEIPVPSPPILVPPVLYTPRIHPPNFTPQPFRMHFLEQEQHPPPSFLHPPRFSISKK